MNGLTGTGKLIRLALRRDRIKLPAWVLIIVLLLAVNVPAVLNFYVGSDQERITYAVTNASSLIGRLFNGPLGGPEIGEIVTNETFMFASVMTAFMSTLAIVRHTRQNEETGRAELIGSAVVARHSQLVAALVVTIGANIILAVLVALALMAQDLSVSGSIGFGAALGAIGICFAGFAAITSQLSESARGANSMAGALIGLFFLLRAAGDSLGHLTEDKMGVVSLWPSWLSPFGWGQQIYFFTEQNWWIFGLFGALFVVLVAVAFYLNSRRDLGSGILPARRGPAHAAASLLSPFGLAWRLQKGILIGWAVAMAVFGLTIGLVVKEFSKLFTENKEMREFLRSLGGQGSFEDVFFAGMLLYLCLFISAYVVQSLQRMQAEQSSGRLEPLLVTGVSKYSWIMSYLLCALVGIAVLLLILGISTSVTYILVADAPWSNVWELTAAAFVHAPAILVLAGFAVASFAILPRASVVLSWLGFGLVLFIGQFSGLLKLPQGIQNISPFTHSPTPPAEAVSLLPLVVLSAVALALTIVGLVWFRRRDVING
ncbi:MAG TPA: hypothetical protein VFM05_00435 [Candidatus Saccharimonadales bacterium]|nr:hypothetical protein [Candidatus Saccharimonadales bacterium]